MSLNIKNLEDVKAAIALVDETKVHDNGGDYSPSGAKEKVELMQQEDEEDFGCAIAEIYSYGGFHRWYVLMSGEVCFSARHSIGEEYTERAKELGIRLW